MLFLEHQHPASFKLAGCLKLYEIGAVRESKVRLDGEFISVYGLTKTTALLLDN